LAVPLRDPAARPPLSAILGLRPEAFAPAGQGRAVTLKAEVVENTGAARYLYTATDRAAALVAEIPRGQSVGTGETLEVGVAAEDCLLFAPEGPRL
ncbi:MAG: TOBE domain-containing protein, partial [Paracoccaceae bacterium]|nr:TOBE domain-containing protein [Paracoccaceae bacterium]